MGKKIAVRSGNEKLARAALEQARKKKEEWAADEWELEQKKVLLEFRVGMTHGGSDRFRTATGKPRLEEGRAGLEEAAVDSQLTPGSTNTKGNVCTQRPVGCSAITPSEERMPSVCNTLSAIGGPALATFQNRIRLEMPSKYLGGGTFGKVYEAKGTSLSAIGGPSAMQVAVKVLPKLTCTADATVVNDKLVANEIEILTSLAGSPGVVQLLSWSEGIFDVHLVFHKFPGSLHDYIYHGDRGSRVANIRSICKQFLVALKHVHAKRIIHRDLKPGNVLVHEGCVDVCLSAIGDLKEPSISLADFGGACQLDVRPGESGTETASSLPGIFREATTYQYRAPEMFVRKSLRANTYATDIWAFGVCIAELAIGSLPFGPAQLRSCQMDEVFVALLKVVYNTNSRLFDEDSRKSRSKFFDKLKALKVQGVRSLPWAAMKDDVVSQILRRCFAAYPPSRPSAESLADALADKMLSV